MPFIFPARSNGQTIDASHMMAVQDAIGIVSSGVWNVREYGAVGNGTTNDQAAIQGAIDACAAAGGGVVVVPASAQPYMVDGLTIKSLVWLLGGGHKRSSIKLRSGRNVPVIKSFTSPDGIQANAFWWTISDLHIDGNRAGQTSSGSHGIEIIMNPNFDFATDEQPPSSSWDFDPDWRVQRVTVQFCKGSGVYQRGRSMGVLDTVWCDDNDRYGKEFSLGTDGYLTGCVTSMSGLTGLFLSGSSNIRVVGHKSYWNGRLDSNDGFGAKIADGANLNMISASEFQDNKGEGVRLENVKGVVLTSCVADSNGVGWGGAAGYGLWAATHCAIIGCTSVERFPNGQQGGTFPTQLNALQIRQGSTHNQINLTHFGLNGVTAGTPLASGSNSVNGAGNSIWINGTQYTTNT